MKKIGFILSTFPTITETFVAGELKILMEKFPGSRIFSLRPPFDKILHQESLEMVDKTQYLPPPFSREVLRSNMDWLLKRPWRYIMVLLYLIYRTILNPLHMLKTLYLFPQAVHLASIIASTDLDHIHSHWSGYPTTAAMIISRLIDIPFSFTSHACDMSMIRTLVAEKVRQASFVVTCTREALNYLRKILPEESLRKIYINYHGSNLKKFRPELRKAGKDGVPLIISCADFHERKGFPYLLRALEVLKRDNRQFRCIIVGDGPQRPLLEKMVKDLGLEDLVEMPGTVTQEVLIQEYYASADMFVLPCTVQRLKFFRKNMDLGRFKILECKMSGGEGIQKDGIPNVLVEAMAMKIPVISTNVGGIAELIKVGKNGLLAIERDHRTLAFLIEELLLSPRIRGLLGENGYRTVHERFDRSKNILALVDIFSGRGRVGDTVLQEGMGTLGAVVSSG